jgi:uncharacterized protein (TIGR02300 family)
MALGGTDNGAELRRLKVAKADWGTKRTCRDCGARFYDLKRDLVPCPQCGTELTIKAAKKTPKKAPPPKVEVEEVAAKPEAPPTANADSDDDAVEDSDEEGVDVSEVAGSNDDDDGEDDDDKDLIEDASDLGEDDDDLSEAREHIDEEVVDKS